MVATHKAESENEEIQGKVRARAAVATKFKEGTTELGQQIAKLMAALTKVGQGSSLAGTPSSPRERGHGRGHAHRGILSCPSSYNGQTGLGQTTPHCSTPTGHRTGATISRNQGQSSQGTNARCEVQPTGGTPTPSSVLDGGHMARECPTPATALNQSGGN